VNGTIPEVGNFGVVLPGSGTKVGHGSQFQIFLTRDLGYLCFFRVPCPHVGSARRQLRYSWSPNDSDGLAVFGILGGSPALL
jgi:hypothetical protein